MPVCLLVLEHVYIAAIVHLLTVLLLPSILEPTYFWFVVSHLVFYADPRFLDLLLQLFIRVQPRHS